MALSLGEDCATGVFEFGEGAQDVCDNLAAR